MRILVVGVAFLVSACKTEVSGEFSHPDLSTEGASAMLGSDSLNLPESVRQAASALIARKATVRIGSMSGAPGTVLARPIAASRLSDGKIVILDAMASEVREFDEDGRFVRTLLGRGRGPQEISLPVGLQVRTARTPSGADTLVVATRVGLKLFEVSDSGAVPVATLQPPDLPSLSDGCLGIGRVFARAGLRPDSGVVATRSLSGGPLTRFGRGYGGGAVLTKEELSVGPIACTPNGAALVAFTYLPRVQLFDPAGVELWTTAIPEFSPLAFEETRRGETAELRSRYDRGGDMIQALRTLEGDVALLQVGRLEAADADRPNVQQIARLSTYLLSLRNGEGGFVSSSLPSVIGFGGGTLFTVEEAPQGHPVVVGYSIQGGQLEDTGR